MKIVISKDADILGKKAASFISWKLNEAVRINGEARLLVSTGASQFEMFENLVLEDVPWQKIEVFHLDEYIGLPVTHPASFRKYLNERFISNVDVKKFHSIDVEDDISSVIGKLTEEIRRKPVDIGIIGIGVNGHIAFNDPPADFETRESYIKVKLDNVCKTQQVNEGWFKSAREVPEFAVSMSVFQIMQCRTIVSCVPHKVKADAIYNMFMRRLTNMVPATILKKHPDYHLYLDYQSASRIIKFEEE
ncbi:MAG: 6-phosphogluconolactonase [Bacteroidales bacterium]|nr:6-phosphogluconolactonase [Bacteroidales bacterium]